MHAIINARWDCVRWLLQHVSDKLMFTVQDTVSLPCFCLRADVCCVFFQMCGQSSLTLAAGRPCPLDLFKQICASSKAVLNDKAVPFLAFYVKFYARIMFGCLRGRRRSPRRTHHCSLPGRLA
jgi:hypothetical protein